MRKIAAALALIGALSPAARADFVARWEARVDSEKKQVFVFDCRHCDESISVILTCDFGSGRVKVELPALAAEAGKEGDLDAVDLAIDGVHYRRAGKLVFWGMIGNFPAIDASLNDALFESLAAGRTFEMSNAGGKSDVPLTGSRRAITAMRKRCVGG